MAPGHARLVESAGPLATLFGRPRLPKNRLRLDPCKDLDRLAEIAERDRDPAFLQPERSVPYLKWVYGSWVDAPGSGETGDVAVYRFATPAGHEGWFSIGYSLRGGRKQIRAARLNDVVWPVEHMPFTDVIPAIVEVVKPRATSCLFAVGSAPDSRTARWDCENEHFGTGKLLDRPQPLDRRPDQCRRFSVR